MRPSARSLVMLLSLVVLAACGDPPRKAAPHGLVLPTLPAEPEGDLLDPHFRPAPGHWVGSIEKRWTETREGQAPREGYARIALDVTRHDAGDGLATTVELRVDAATGLAEEYVRGFYGVRGTVRHGADGRPDPATLRFETQAPPSARSFLTGFWMAGIVGASPWIPPGPHRVGASWPREALGTPPGLDTILREHPSATTRLEGGGRLESASSGSQGPTWEVRLTSLLEVDAATHDDAISLGVLDEGHGTLWPESALPQAWTLVETTRLSRLERGVPRTFEVRLEVEGRLEPAAVGPR